MVYKSVHEVRGVFEYYTYAISGSEVGDADTRKPPQLLLATADREDGNSLAGVANATKDLQTSHVEAEHVVPELDAHGSGRSLEDRK